VAASNNGTDYIAIGIIRGRTLHTPAGIAHRGLKPVRDIMLLDNFR